MAILEIAKLGNPILRKVAEPVTQEAYQDPSFQLFLDDMIDTMQEMDGVGLAAPQVYQSKQILVIYSNENPRYPSATDLPLLVLLNPRLTILSDEMVDGWESCLSVKDLRGMVSRYRRVHVSGFDRHMAPVEFEAEGFLSVVLQHEIDHLYGKVFLDRMADFSTLTHLDEFEHYWRPSQEAVKS